MRSLETLRRIGFGLSRIGEFPTRKYVLHSNYSSVEELIRVCDSKFNLIPAPALCPVLPSIGPVNPHGIEASMMSNKVQIKFK